MPDLFIDGHWVAPAEGGTRMLTCPATGEDLTTVDEATETDTLAAIDAAYRAFADGQGEWPRTPMRERAALLSRVADILRRDKAAIAEVEALDTGKRYVEAEYDIDDVVSVFEHYARLGADHDDAGRTVETGREGIKSRVVKEPIGVCALITPWNYPLLQASWKVAPCLLAGNTFVLKPSEITPRSTIALARAL
ncbi:MAG TPA: aldehyde dehydrogenase family protein, partial [Phycicoccus sp.]|nr:aldehyde dehydrogenase family protein [Phycicoccus sp.]